MNTAVQSYPQGFLKQNAPLVVGLDIRESLRLVLAEAPEDCPEPTVLEHHRFRSLEGLQRYLRPSIRDRIEVVSVQADHGDPLGVKTWLSACNLHTHHHHHPGWSGHRLGLQSHREFWELPSSYQLAYTLAFLSSYRLHGGKTIGKLWTQTNQLREILDDYESELARLSHALGNGSVRPSLHQWLCPF